MNNEELKLRVGSNIARLRPGDPRTGADAGACARAGV